MLKPLFVVALMLPVAVHAQDAGTSEDTEVSTEEGTEGAETEGADATALTRPGVASGEAAPRLSDDLAECASILAIASTHSNSLVQRRSLEAGASQWFARAGDVALEEGELPEEDLWGQKVASWAGQIGGMDGLSRHADWLTYCAQIGSAHGLSAEIFTPG